MYELYESIRVKNKKEQDWGTEEFFSVINGEVYCFFDGDDSATHREGGNSFMIMRYAYHEKIKLGDEHPLLVEALKNKLPVKCDVNPEQNELFQKICFENQVFWYLGTKGSLKYLDKNLLFATTNGEEYVITCGTSDSTFSKHHAREYDFTNKCFVEKKEEPAKKIITPEMLNGWWKRKDKTIVARISVSACSKTMAKGFIIDGLLHNSLDELFKLWQPISDQEALDFFNEL